jgi:hypothetical protein
MLKGFGAIFTGVGFTLTLVVTSTAPGAIWIPGHQPPDSRRRDFFVLAALQRLSQVFVIRYRKSDTAGGAAT